MVIKKMSEQKSIGCVKSRKICRVELKTRKRKARKSTKNENLPLCCPLVEECRKQESYAYEVRTVASVGKQITLDEDEWEYVKNCPHKMQEGLVRIRSFDKSEFWLHYLKCTVFSKWFWENCAKVQKASNLKATNFSKGPSEATHNDKAKNMKEGGAI